MTDYAECPVCHISSSVTDKVLDRKCRHAVMTHVQLPVGDAPGGTVVKFATDDRMMVENVLCSVRATMTDERFFKAIEEMDLETIADIEGKLAHRKAELEFVR